MDTQFQKEYEKFEVVATYVALSGLVLHGVFLLFFHRLGLSTLVWYNVFSIAVFGLSPTLLRRKKYHLVIFIIAFEVIVHAGLTTWYLGMASGFHLYVIALITAAFHPPRLSLVQKLLFFGIICLSYLFIQGQIGSNPPVVALDAAYLELVGHANALGAFILMGFISYHFSSAIGDFKDAAETDPLTGLANRYQARNFITQHMMRRESDHHMAFILLDLDRFKEINDTFGHSAGDIVLQEAARRLRLTMRREDLLARWGGEEFLAILPSSSCDTAMNIAERMRHILTEKPVNIGDKSIEIDVTAGISSLGEFESSDDAIKRADDALYAGKNAGRGRCIYADPATNEA